MAAESAAAQMPRAGLVVQLSSVLGALWSRLAPIFSAMPDVPREAAAALRGIAASGQGAFIGDMARAAIAIALILAVSWFFDFYRALRRRQVGQVDPLVAIVRRFVLDGVGALVVLLGAIIVSETFFSGKSHSSELGAALLDLAVRFRLALLAPAILFRPGEPALRLLSASEAQIRRAQPWFFAALLFGLGFPTLIPIWLSAGMDWHAGQALAVLVGGLVALLGFVALARFLSVDPPLWRQWRLTAVLAAIGFWGTWCYGVITLDFPFYSAVISTALIVLVGLIIDRFLVASHQVASAAEHAQTDSYRFWRDFSAALRRVTLVLALAGFASVIANWLLEMQPGWLSGARLTMVQHGLGEALFVFCSGYLIFEVLTSWSRARFSPPPAGQIPGIGDDDNEPAPASRLTTIMPLLQGFLGVFIIGASSLAALSKLGVDTTPLLAGAGIFGLAISFGSQSLVRDIVAGIFYMADDAFRIGEYIEAARLKGNVERISLRSVRLRHQNGQIHTLPFGQLGSVTNYSRDYATMKFNLRLSRDVDLEVARKAAKKVGLDFLEDPEFGKEFLQPLKMQGVADILENALVVRFKFTVRPGKQTYVQREAIKRLIRAFAEKGVRFATHSVTIQNASEDDDQDDREAAEKAVALSVTRAPLAPPAPPPPR